MQSKLVAEISRPTSPRRPILAPIFTAVAAAVVFVAGAAAVLYHVNLHPQDFVKPFPGLIPWQDFSFSFPPEEAPRILDTLRAVPEAKLTRMQVGARNAHLVGNCFTSGDVCRAFGDCMCKSIV